jgi:hypothetical protein
MMMCQFLDGGREGEGVDRGDNNCVYCQCFSTSTHNKCCLTLRPLFGPGMVPHAPTHLLLTATGLIDIVPSNITDRPNHLHCNFKSHPVFPAALSSPFSVTTYITICKTNRSPIFHFFNHCIHHTS